MSRQGATTVPLDYPDPSHTEDTVHRFGLTERLTHWWTVSMVAVALLTGLGIGDESASGPMLTAHIAAVVLIGVGLLTAVVVGDTRSLLRATYHLFVFDRRDAEWVRAHARPAHRGTHGEWGMFNPGQKALAWALTVAISAVIYTGIVSWRAGGEDGGSGHAAAVVVAMALVASHIFMAVVNPSTRPALAGMVRGRVRRSWAAEHHAGWLRDIDRRSHPRR
jgi:formate dehydrogenase subunit gamma